MRSVDLLGRVALLLAALSVAAGCGRPADTGEPAPPPAGTVVLSDGARRMAGIVTEPVASASAVAAFDAVGTIALDDTRTSRIGALVEGVVSATHVNVGDLVARHALLAGLHSHDLHDGWADYRKAVADRRRAVQEVAFAADALARAERLLEDKAASTLEVERARSARVGANEQLTMADAEIRRTQESLEHLGITATTEPGTPTTEIIPVRTPQAGVVLERLVTTGTAVTPGMPMFVVSDLGSLWALAEIDETSLPQIRVGAPVSVRVPAYGEEIFPATVTQVADALNPETRRAVVRCRVANPGRRLKPGMFARLSLTGAVLPAALQVPAEAVVDLGERRVVFVPDGKGAYRPRDVEVGVERGGRVEIRGGLTAGERVVTRGAFLLKSQLLASQEAQ
jgi:membrane fusion protein, heavy metal efflux system